MTEEITGLCPDKPKFEIGNIVNVCWDNSLMGEIVAGPVKMPGKILITDTKTNLDVWAGSDHTFLCWGVKFNGSRDDEVKFVWQGALLLGIPEAKGEEHPDLTGLDQDPYPSEWPGDDDLDDDDF